MNTLSYTPLTPPAAFRTPARVTPPRKTRGLWALLLSTALVWLCSWLLSRLLAADPGTLDTLMYYRSLIFTAGPSMFAGAITFSVAEMLLLAIPALLAILLLRAVVMMLLRRMPPSRFVAGVLICALIASTLYAIFTLGWGLNYHRLPISDELGLQVDTYTPQQLASLYSDLVDEANALRVHVKEDSRGVFDPADKDVILAQVPKAFARMGKVWPRFDRPFPAAKPVMLSRYMSYSGITGIFIPFTEEANVNVDMPKLLLYAVAAHETSHLAGVAPEDEANFVAYVACAYSASPAMRYSGAMFAAIYVGNALRDADEEAYSAIHARMSDALTRDLQDYSEYWKRFEGPVQEQVEQTNDAYLKYNGQSDGTQSYGRMVDLLLAWKGY